MDINWKLPSLNGLRAISIILVIFHHIQIQYAVFDMPFNPLVRLLVDGQFGVNVFFVISGFLITALLLKEEYKFGRIALKQFFIRRMLRIFPAYYFLLLVYFCISHFSYISISTTSWLSAITFTKYFTKMEDWYTYHTWSLSVEEHFYLIWPFVFILGLKVRKIFAFITLCIPIILRILVYNYPISWLNELTIFIRIDAISIGCLVALYQQEIIESVKYHWNILLWGSISIILLVPYANGLAKRMDIGSIFVPFGISNGLFANVCIAVIMVCSVFGPKQTMWFRFLNSTVMNSIGILSYSLYLWQQFFIVKTSYWINQFPQNIGLTIFAACFSYFIVEKPFLRLKSKFAPRKSTVENSV